MRELALQDLLNCLKSRKEIADRLRQVFGLQSCDCELVTVIIPRTWKLSVDLKACKIKKSKNVEKVNLQSTRAINVS